LLFVECPPGVCRYANDFVVRLLQTSSGDGQGSKQESWMSSTSIKSTNNNMIVVPIKKEFEYEELVEMNEPHLPHLQQQQPTSTKSADSNPVPVTRSPPILDLREWKGHRVLAKRDSVYMPGVIVGVIEHSTITVTFDADGVPVTYTDVIISNSSFYDIVSDASPTPSQVTHGRIDYIP